MLIYWLFWKNSGGEYTFLNGNMSERWSKCIVMWSNNLVTMNFSAMTQIFLGLIFPSQPCQMNSTSTSTYFFISTTLIYKGILLQPCYTQINYLIFRLAYFIKFAIKIMELQKLLLKIYYF